MAAVPTIGRATGVERKPTAPEADATRALYEQYSRQILNYCVHQLNSREEAEDAVQTTFMNAFRGLKRGVVPEAEQAWLFKIAENVCLSRRRSSWRRGKVESPNDFEVLQEIVPSKHANRADELIGLEDALEAMPENQRRAILLREWQGLSYREIADELELSQAAVETLIFRARRSLAAGLESPATPKRRRRINAAGDGISLGSLIAGLKSALTGGAAIHAVAAAVAAGSATVAVTQVEPALVHHLYHAAKPAAVVHVTKQSQVTFSPQATIVARASGMSVAQAHKQSDRGASLNDAVAQAGKAPGHARSVTMPEDVTHAQAPPMVPMAPTAPATPVTPTAPVPEAPVAAAPSTPTEQPKTDAPKTTPPTSDSPKTAAPKSEPTKSGDSPGKSGNGNEGKQSDSGTKTADTPKAADPPKTGDTNQGNGNGNAKTTGDAPKSDPVKTSGDNQSAGATGKTTTTASDTPKSDPAKGNSDNQGNGNRTTSTDSSKATPQPTANTDKSNGNSDNKGSSDKSKASPPVAVTPPAPTPPAPAAQTSNANNGNGNGNDKSKGSDKKADPPTPAPPVAAAPPAAPQAPVAPPVQPTNSPMHGVGNGGNGNGGNGNGGDNNSNKDNGGDRGGDKGRGKGK